MPASVPAWPAWACFTAMMLAHAPYARSETPTPAQTVQLMDLARLAREARLAGDHKGWLEHGQRVLQLAPEHPDLLISVARALAANGRFEPAEARLDDAVRRGAGFDLSTFPEFKSAPDSGRLRAVRERALQNLAPVSAPEVFLALQDESLRPEGITWDPIGGHLYFGSLSGEIWRVDLGGKLERFAGADSGLREVLGLKVDSQRRLLWAVTGVFPDVIPTGEPKKDVGTTGLHAYRLDTRERVRECGLDERPTLHAFNDMALARNGDVYVTDSPASSIYKLSGTACKLDQILHDAAVSFPNGIALAPDESRLYIAHVEGISVVDLRTAKRTQLPVPANAAVNSIDGLAWDGNDLLAIQGSPYLARVARIRLGADGLAVRQVETMSSRPPADLRPTTGVVVRDQFYMVAGFPDGIAAATGQPRPRSHILRARVR
ncbi:MAG TPA: SMP-30/gluconolactonase/LRE family protein [Steroidobacteraceae bacterium]|jgi:sugar lactone lactonase YvrE|nr:SMP-30/gluconolactonase/LRE family protein [Steroidobacteraceae bacterium]